MKPDSCSARLWCCLAGLLFIAGCQSKSDSVTPPGGEGRTAQQRERIAEPVGGSAGQAVGVGGEAAPRGAKKERRIPRLGQTPPSTEADAADLSVRPDDWFEDVTGMTGIDAVYRNGREAEKFLILESLGGGVAMVDYDLDGDLDLAFAGGGTFSGEDPIVVSGLPSSFFRNEGDWKFTRVTSEVRLEEAPDYSHGLTMADYDADGFPDLLLSCYGRSRIYRNLGDGTFGEATKPETFPVQRWGTSAGWADIDRDGLPDLFLGSYLDWDPSRELVCRDGFGNRDVCGPAQYPGTIGKFLHNEGDGSFADWTLRVGLVGDVKGLGVVACDFDDDGWIDFYCANDETPNHLYLGREDFTLQECGKASGVAWNEYGVEEGSMGLGVDDFDGDGRPDIFVTNFENEDNALYRNLGNGQFKHVSVALGVSGHSRMMVGFGTIMGDFDGDSWPDLLVCNGNAVYSMGQGPYQQKPQLFRNSAGRKFEQISQQGGSYFRTSHVGRGIAVGDLDGDGGIDVVVTHQNEPATILRNRQPPRNFVKIQLRATGGEASAVGSRVTLIGGERPVVKQIVQGIGYFSQSDLSVILPLPSGMMSTEVIVSWLGRGNETFRDLTAGQTHTLVEGRGIHGSQ